MQWWPPAGSIWPATPSGRSAARETCRGQSETRAGRTGPRLGCPENGNGRPCSAGTPVIASSRRGGDVLPAEVDVGARDRAEDERRRQHVAVIPAGPRVGAVLGRGGFQGQAAQRSLG